MEAGPPAINFSGKRHEGYLVGLLVLIDPGVASGAACGPWEPSGTEDLNRSFGSFPGKFLEAVRLAPNNVPG